MHGDGLLPAWPVRAACAPLGVHTLDDDEALFDAAWAAVSVYYNHSGDAGRCYQIGRERASTPALRPRMSSPLRAAPAETTRSQPTRSYPTQSQPTRSQPAVECNPLGSVPCEPSSAAASCEGNWGYQWCTEMVQPFTSGGERDMFFPSAPYDYSASAAACVSTWGVRPTESWARIGLGGKRIRDASKIIFSNGALDPWSAGGVLESPAESVHTIMIPSGAHHIDLMFSDEADPADVREARQKEMQIIAGWIQDAK